MRSKQLGQLLLENGDVQAEQVAQALKQQEEQGGIVGQILQITGACTAQAIGAALLKQVQVTDIRCDELSVDPEVAELVPRELCESERLCPFERLGNLLCLVMANPLNRKAITQIEEKTHLKVKSFKSIWAPISQLIDRTYGAPPAEEGAPLEEMTSDDLPPLDLDMGDGGPAAPMQIDIPEPALMAAPSGLATISSLARRSRLPEGPAAAKVTGMDDLDDSKAEMIETNKRGLSQRGKKSVIDDIPSKPKPQKVAKVNVDLDALDLSSGEVVAGAGDEIEGFEEIAQTVYKRKPIGVTLTAIEDNYFYTDGPAPKGARADALLDVIETLPVAEVVAQSIGEFESQQCEKAAKSAKAAPQKVLKESPLELQPSPVSAMTAVLISEAEFQKQIASMGEDPIGEWDWHFVAAGPVAAQAYEEA